MGDFVDQLKFCDLVIMPSFGLLAFSQNRISCHLLLFKIFLIFQNRSQDLFFKQKLYPNLSIYETIGI
jgi:hypothetical protein